MKVPRTYGWVRKEAVQIEVGLMDRNQNSHIQPPLLVTTNLATTQKKKLHLKEEKKSIRRN